VKLPADRQILNDRIIAIERAHPEIFICPPWASADNLWHAIAGGDSAPYDSGIAMIEALEDRFRDLPGGSA
jgi:hypothetical protein